MKLTWLGHACFLLETACGSVVFDPYEPGYVPGLALLGIEPTGLLQGPLAVLPAQSQNFGAVRCNGDGVLKVSSQAAVAGLDRPSIG